MSAMTRWAGLKRHGVITGERAEWDFYPTDPEHVEEAFNHLPEESNGWAFEPQRILDPCAGDGVYGWFARERFRHAYIEGMDIRPIKFNKYSYNVGKNGDFLRASDDVEPFDLVISNPPFVVAREFVEHSFRMLRPGGVVNFLLRAQFAESEGRYEWFQRYRPRYIVTCSDRPSFREDGSPDPAHYAFFVWQKGWEGETIHRWCMADKEKAAKLTAQKRLID